MTPMLGTLVYNKADVLDVLQYIFCNSYYPESTLVDCRKLVSDMLHDPKLVFNWRVKAVHLEGLVVSYDGDDNIIAWSAAFAGFGQGGCDYDLSDYGLSKYTLILVNYIVPKWRRVLSASQHYKVLRQWFANKLKPGKSVGFVIMSN
jgi:hypothetical protein